MLRRDYGISVMEYLHTLPAWEADLLLEQASDEEGDVEPDVPAPDPFDDVPDHLRDL